MSTYIIGDVHNALDKLNHLLDQISPSSEDHLYFLGDLFDRGGENPDPVGVYFKIGWLKTNVTWIRGNHEQLLAEYIMDYYKTPEKKRWKLPPYEYNSFDIMAERFVEVDMLNLADRLMELPLQVEISVGSEVYLLAHAMTSASSDEMDDDQHLNGCAHMEDFFANGIKGYISIVGHTDTAYMFRKYIGTYLDGESCSIWKNNKGNLYLLDCGSGAGSGKIACMCLETGERYYA